MLRNWWQRILGAKFRQPAPNKRFRLTLEYLEDRVLPTATLYIDYGDRFPGGVLNTTVGGIRSTVSGSNPNIDGPQLFDSSGTNYASATSVAVSSLNRLYGVATASTMRATMDALVQRFYQGLDITVVDLTATPQNVNGHTVQAASSLAEISQTLGANEGDAKNNDTYVIVGQFIINGTDNPRFFATNGYGGISTATDIGGLNNNDGTALVMLKGSGDGVLFNGDQIAHEAGHAFGLRHVFRQDSQNSPPTLSNTTATGAQYDVLHSSEIMSYLGYDGLDFFTRFPMMRGDGNTNASILSNAPTPFDQMANDPNIGASTFEYVTGTGANNIITITKTSGTTANVSVQAFADTAYTIPIDAPGATGNTYSYSITLTKPLIVDSGKGNDRIILDGDLNNTITLRGMQGTDELIVMGKGAASARYTPNSSAPAGLDGVASYGGQVAIGSTTINFSEFETSSRVTIQNINTLTLLGTNGSDNLTLDGPVSGNSRVQGTVNTGVSFVPLLFSSVSNLNINGLGGAGGNDIFNVKATPSGVSTVIDSGGGNDTVNIGSLAPTTAGGNLAGILGALTIQNAAGGKAIVSIDDSGDGSARTSATIDTFVSGDTFGRLTNLGNTAVISWDINDASSGQNDVDALAINGGATGNTFQIGGIDSPRSSYSLTVNSGNGSDTVSVDPQPINTNLTVNGQNPTTTPGDTLNYTGTGTDIPGGTGSGTITESGRATVSYSGIEAVNVGSVVPTGTWTELSNSAPGTPPPDGGMTMMLLSDGSVLVHDGLNQAGVDPSTAFYKLSPQANTGSYVNGVWTQVHSMNESRLDFPTAMLADGRIFAVGGEYPEDSNGHLVNTAEIYSPVANTWTNVDPFPQADFGDDPIEVLSTGPFSGQVLAGYIFDGTTYRFNPAAPAGSQWVQTAGSKLRNDRSDEETWVKLPDGSILSYDVFASAASGIFHAQRYIPASDTWMDASNVDPANPPSLLTSAAQTNELGPAFLQPDGNVIYFGANGKTAIYNPTSDRWSAGFDEPMKDGNLLVAADNPGAVLPNGHILIALSPLGSLDASGAYTFPGPTDIFEYDPTATTAAQAWRDVTPGDPGNGGQSVTVNAFNTDMLILPNGQILLSTENGGAFQIYTPSGSPQDAWRPTITNIVNNGDGTFTLTGTQLNGISEGSTYGDDNENASNYPIIQVTDSAGNVNYARTFNWSSTGVMTGSTPVTTQFTMPAGPFAPGSLSIKAIANGIASASYIIPAVQPFPRVTGISPTAGPTAGGTMVTITGVNLTNATEVDFGTTAVTSFASNTGTQLVVVSPVGAPGTVHITVKTAGGTSTTSTGDQFTYVSPPSVTGISPIAGPLTGGTTVTITGSNLANATEVDFGTTAVTTFTSITNTQIVLVSPAGSAGPVDITVKTAGGTSATSLSDRFTYVAPPSVTRVSPSGGPLAGGTLVTITGVNLANATEIDFGTAVVSVFTVNFTGTQITLFSPAGTGIVHVTVKTAGGTSATSASDQFTYVPPPTISSIASSAGPVGGTVVTITGSNFSGVTSVTFDGVEATSFVVNSPTQIMAVAPQHPIGTVDIIVTTKGGASALSANDQFTYVKYETNTAVGNLVAKFAFANQVVNLGAYVSGGPGTVDDGVVAFTVLDGNNNVIGAPVTGSVRNSGTYVPFTLPGNTPAGDYTIVAIYGGGTDFQPSVSNTVLTIVPGTTIIKVSKVAKTTYSNSDQQVHLKAHVSSKPTTLITGMVTFTLSDDLGNMIGTATSTSAAIGAAEVDYLVPGGTAAGTYQVTVDYEAAANFADSSNDSKFLTIAKARSATVASSAAATSATMEQFITLSAMVSSSAGMVDHQGTVTFTVILGRRIVVSTAPAEVVNGQASTTFALPGGTLPGRYKIKAVYSGNDDLLGSTDSTSS